LNEIPFTELRLGGLLAEGGEGRVFEVTRAPLPTPVGASGLVFKQLRQARPLAELSPVVAFPSTLAVTDAGLAARVWAASAWPLAVVVGADPSVGVGLLMPRAPANFWLQHRDGPPRLATLSYLAGDPDRITLAYGVPVPAPGGAERVAIVYSLCRLLEPWQAPGGGAHVVHGDLSAKNVLWSLQPTPAVYVLDCDGAAVGTTDATPLGTAVGTAGGAAPMAVAPSSPPAGGAQPGDSSTGPRVRATTPNWDDPAATPGSAPTEAADRYLLGLTFLRVVGAAHFPLQRRQRAAERVSVDLELPRSWRRLPDMAGLWEMCERSLSLVDVAGRPHPMEWSAHLEELLDVLGAGDLAAQVRAAQGDPRASSELSPAPGPRPAGLATAHLATAHLATAHLATARVTVPDVVVRPVLRQRAVPTWQLINGRGSAAIADPVGAAAAAGGSAVGGLSPREFVRRSMTAWGGAHRLALRLVRLPGRRGHGVRRLAGVLAIDLSAGCAIIFLTAMVVSPWIGL
jgi:hypothetical protein